MHSRLNWSCFEKISQRIDRPQVNQSANQLTSNFYACKLPGSSRNYELNWELFYVLAASVQRDGRHSTDEEAGNEQGMSLSLAWDACFSLLIFWQRLICSFIGSSCRRFSAAVVLVICSFYYYIVHCTTFMGVVSDCWYNWQTICSFTSVVVVVVVVVDLLLLRLSSTTLLSLALLCTVHPRTVLIVVSLSVSCHHVSQSFADWCSAAEVRQERAL